MWRFSIFTVMIILSGVVNATSLFDDAKFRAYTSDLRAHQIGDTLTIVILENSQATTSAGNSSESDFKINASATSPQGSWPFSANVGAGQSGDAVIKRNGFVRSQITAVVTGVDKSGNLIVKGQQQIVIDGETQSIEVSGSIRSADISSSNSVPSYRLYDANIKFVGQGDVTDGQSRGIFYQAFKWLGLI